MNQGYVEKVNRDVVVYDSKDGQISFEVSVFNESVWVTQAQMSNLFERDQSVIARHISNIFKEKELIKNSVYAKHAYTASDGKVYEVDHYSLDLVISVGYRVRSRRGIEFRQWGASIIKKYMLEGYVVNNRRIELIEDQLKLLGEKISDIQSDSNLKQENRLLQNQIDIKTQNDKIKQMAEKIGEINELMKDFQNTHLIIKRLEECGGVG